jgi:hypothetical protein
VAADLRCALTGSAEVWGQPGGGVAFRELYRFAHSRSDVASLSGDESCDGAAADSAKHTAEPTEFVITTVRARLAAATSILEMWK